MTPVLQRQSWHQVPQENQGAHTWNVRPQAPTPAASPKIQSFIGMWFFMHPRAELGGFHLEPIHTPKSPRQWLGADEVNGLVLTVMVTE